MRFIFTGFTPGMVFRVFAFQRLAADYTRTEFTVKADLSLVRKHGIHLQELPLLCRALLEDHKGLMSGDDLIFTEADMCRHQSACAAVKEAAALKKWRKPSNANAGGGWRTTPLHL